MGPQDPSLESADNHSSVCVSLRGPGDVQHRGFFHLSVSQPLNDLAIAIRMYLKIREKCPRIARARSLQLEPFGGTLTKQSGPPRAGTRRRA